MKAPWYAEAAKLERQHHAETAALMLRPAPPRPSNDYSNWFGETVRISEY